MITEYRSSPEPHAYILLPGWHMHMKTTEIYRRRFLSEKPCLQYEFSPEILSADQQATKMHFFNIRDQIRLDMMQLANEGKTSFTIIAYSLGCVNAMMVADKNDLVDELVLVTPTNSLAEVVWKGARTKDIRRDMEKQGITLEKLSEYWIDMAPENMRPAQVDMSLFISKADTYVPYACAKKFAEKMKTYRPVVKENRYLGHKLTIGKHLFFNA